MKKKFLLPVIAVFFFGLFIYYLGWSFSPGSYPYAEFYELNVSEKKLIEIIHEVKKENNELNWHSSRFTDNRHKFWYSIYFGLEDKNQIIKTWTRPKNKTITTFAFVSYKTTNKSNGWINANEYFWWWKNSKAKKEFETRILNKIELKIKTLKQKGL